MALSIDWSTKVISVPKADMLQTQVSPFEVRELDIDLFRLELKSIEDSEEGMPHLDTHQHVGPITVGGVTLARVVEIINGYTITFENGSYAVDIAGGNSNIADVANLNSVSIRSANSAGLAISKEVEDLSFESARVWIDVDDGAAGTQYPLGTPARPVSNYADAAAIIASRSFSPRYHLRGTITLSDDEPSSNWLGNSALVDTITLSGAVDIDDATFERVQVSGSMLGHAKFIECIIGATTGFFGKAIGCGITGTLTMPAGALTQDVILVHCYSVVPGTSTPVIDCNDATGLDLSIRNYSGGIEVRNFSDVGNAMTIDLNSGHAVLDSTVTAGTIVVRGTGHLTDNSSGATVITSGLVTTEPMLDLLEADEEYSATTAKKFHKTTKALILSKNVSGGTAPASTITIDE